MVVIAAYNEGRRIGEVLRRLAAERLDVVVVDDGSTDDTAVVASAGSAVVLRHAVNRGQGAALQTGITFALRVGADVIVTFDADGQHDPDDIDKLVAPVMAGTCDIALGSRFLDARSSVPHARRMLLKAGILFTRSLSRVSVTDTHNGLRALGRKAAGELVISSDRMAHASQIIDAIRVHRWRFVEVPVVISYTTASLAKGQRGTNAIRIAFQVLAERLRS